MSSELTVRHPELSDAMSMHRLIERTPGLDTNSPYLYAMLCRDFAHCCAVATEDGDMVGVLTGYLRPNHPSTYFAWQTAVAPEATQADIAVRMYDLVLTDASDEPIDTIEMSIDASNRAIKLLLSRLAKRLDASRSSELLFSAEQLGGGHYPETLHVLHMRTPTSSANSARHATQIGRDREAHAVYKSTRGAHVGGKREQPA